MENNTSLHEKNLWPNEYKELLKNDGGWYEFSQIERGQRSQQFISYCMAYKEAADILVNKSLSERDTFFLDLLVIPVLFLYRHYIEISLKSFIIEYSLETDEELVNKFKGAKGHNLINLWSEYYKINKKYLAKKEKNTFNIVEEYIKDFNKHDEISTNFRYPVNTKLELNFRENQIINLKHLKEVLDEIEGFFNGNFDYMENIKSIESNIKDDLHE